MKIFFKQALKFADTHKACQHALILPYDLADTVSGEEEFPGELGDGHAFFMQAFYFGVALVVFAARAVFDAPTFPYLGDERDIDRRAVYIFLNFAEQIRRDDVLCVKIIQVVLPLTHFTGAGENPVNRNKHSIEDPCYVYSFS